MMGAECACNTSVKAAIEGGVRRLQPETTTIFEGVFSLLHCAIKDVGLYRGVSAVRLFPIRYPRRFISLRYTDLEDKLKEIGVIEDLAEFPDEQRILVENALAKQYHEKIIKRIFEVKCEYGILVFQVESQSGREQFMMPWRYDRAEDYGRKGKALLDALDNRYVILDLDQLPDGDRRRLTSYIYW